jgi:hypothetical protein
MVLGQFSDICGKLAKDLRTTVKNVDKNVLLKCQRMQKLLGIFNKNYS